MTFYELLGWVTTVCFNVSYIPQLWKIYKTKKVEDISVGYLLFLLAAYVCGLVYSISIKAWPIVYSHGAGLTFLICFFALYYKYKREVPHVPNKRRNR